MPSFRKKYAKKPRKKTYSQYKSKKRNTALKNGLGKSPAGGQVLNKYAMKPHYYEESFTTPPSIGSGSDVSIIASFNMQQLGRYAVLKSMYHRYRVKFIKLRINMLTIENQDGNVIPELYIRYNYDPQITVPLTLATMIRQQNVHYKRFLQGEGMNGSEFTYTVKPAVMAAKKLYQLSTFSPSPLFNEWCDFQLTGVDIEHYGIQAYWSNLPVGVTMEYTFTVGYECKDII